MPIDLGGSLSRLVDPLGLFSGQGNNGVGTGARPHPVHGEQGRGGPGQDGGITRGGDAPRYGNGNAGGVGTGNQAGMPANLPATTPVPAIPSPASPVAMVNHVAQGVSQALPGSPTLPGLPGLPVLAPTSAPPGMAAAPAAMTSTPAAFASPGTPAFTGGPGQPALPATLGAAHTVANTVAQAPVSTVSGLARAMNHAAPVQPQAHSQPGLAQSALARATPHAPSQAPVHAGGPVPANANAHAGASANAHATQAQLYSAAHRATETPVAPRMPASQNAFHPASQASHPAQAATARPGTMAPQAPHAAQAQPGGPQSPVPAQAQQAATGTPPGAEARTAPQAAQAMSPAPGTTQANAASQANAPAAQQAQQAGQQAQQAQQAQQVVPLAAALAAGSTAVEARPVVPAGNERSQVLLDPSQNPSGHTAERGTRRSLRNRMERAQQSLLRMLGLSMLDTGLRRHPDGHTAMGLHGRAGKGVWFALPWLFWLLAVVAYGCLTLALLVMVGPVAGSARASAGGAAMPIVLGVGLAAGAGAWMMARARRGARYRRRSR